ncbi:hypothetical protein H0G72_00125 [Liberibacter sp. Z1]|nr:hypothetical protein [Candidatus Liberibacter sp.]
MSYNPVLNAVGQPLYDIWLKRCQKSFDISSQEDQYLFELEEKTENRVEGGISK